MDEGGIPNSCSTSHFNIYHNLIYYYYYFM